MTPEEYNIDWLLHDDSEYLDESILPFVTELVRTFQEKHGLVVDGKCGPTTQAAIQKAFEERARPPQLPAQKPTSDIVDDIYLPANYLPIHSSWTSGKRRQPVGGVVWHYSDTDGGTAENMAKRRFKAFNPKTDRYASWHVSIEKDGTVIQMAPFDVICWHAGGTDTRKIPGLGWANQTCIGIELIGRGDAFPPVQVVEAMNLLRAIVKTYGIKREFAMLEHSKISPHDRKDPGPLWMKDYANHILDSAYAP